MRKNQSKKIFISFFSLINKLYCEYFKIIEWIVKFEFNIFISTLNNNFILDL